MGKTAEQPSKITSVVIVGGGFSGTIQAINLLRHNGPRTYLVERRPDPGRGIAYSALLDDHVLNVRASNMSALPDKPDHFVKWLEARKLGLPTDFVSRRTYGDYLAELLAEASARAPGQLELVQDEAVDLSRSAEQFQLRLGSGRVIAADAAVLAVGNLPPHEIAPLAKAGLDEDLYASNPWSQAIGKGLSAGDEVLLLGSGLTMVDAALFLASGDYKGKIIAISRRGLLPRAHAEPAPPPARLPEKPDNLGAALVHDLRARAACGGWRNAVDQLRPYTQMIWRSASIAERGRFLRHLRPWWDVHRHRIATQVASRLDRLSAQGRLEVLAGKVLDVRPAPGGVTVRWRPRGEVEDRAMSVRRIVNCTGPQGDLLRTSEPFLRRLIERGMIRPDPLRLGIDVDQQSQVVDARGAVQRKLFAIGPMTRGAFWEIVAVPDIRMQTWMLARIICDAHWVGGEGL